MATPYRLCTLLARLSLRRVHSIACERSCSVKQLVSQSSAQCVPALTVVREYSIFTQVPASTLWDGVTGVSNAGRKKGRGKRVGRKRITDLNKGQVLGVGKANMLWPGLNTAITKGRAVMQRRQFPEDPGRSQEIVNMRDQLSRIRHPALPPLIRGWSGSRFPGQSVGQPDPVADYAFDGFDSRVLEFKLVSNMTGTLGRKMTFSALVVTGNKNGLAGFGLGKSQQGKGAIRIAKNRAAQRLVYVPRFEDHTVFHNMFVKYHHSKVFIHRKEKGYGLKCHRAIKTIAQLMGFKNLHCKVEGSTGNINAITRAFFDAVSTQETHQELAERMGYYVVELRKERSNLPVVVGTPSGDHIEESELKDEDEDLHVDFERLYYGGRCELKKRPREPFFAYGRTAKAWIKKKAEVHALRNQPHAQIMRKAGLW